MAPSSLENMKRRKGTNIYVQPLLVLGPVTEALKWMPPPPPPSSGWPGGGHVKALWDPTRIQITGCAKGNLVDKAVLGTDVKSSLKATLRELGVLLFKIDLF